MVCRKYSAIAIWPRCWDLYIAEMTFLEKNREQQTYVVMIDRKKKGGVYCHFHFHINKNKII